MRLLIPGLILTLVNANVLASRVVAEVGLFTLLIIVTDMWQSRDDPKFRILLGLLALGLGISLFTPAALAIGAGLGILAASAAMIFGLRSRSGIGVVALSVLLLFACIATYRSRPTALITAGLTPFFLALMRPGRHRPAASTLFTALFLAFAALISYRDGNVGWQALCLYVPGASAVRAISRIGMMLLIPWAIGLAYFVEALVARRRPVWGLVVTLLCLIEQGLTTPSFDKDEHRNSVAALVRRIDRRAMAFYFSPHDADRDKSPELRNLQAMWASLESGVPTINGYSGNYPPGWLPLHDSNIQEECQALCLEASLREWASARGLPLERIGWIGGPEGWRERHARAVPFPNRSIAQDAPFGR
jgi:hypothetical protein